MKIYNFGKWETKDKWKWRLVALSEWKHCLVWWLHTQTPSIVNWSYLQRYLSDRHLSHCKREMNNVMHWKMLCMAPARCHSLSVRPFPLIPFLTWKAPLSLQPRKCLASKTSREDGGYKQLGCFLRCLKRHKQEENEKCYVWLNFSSIPPLTWPWPKSDSHYMMIVKWLMYTMMYM